MVGMQATSTQCNVRSVIKNVLLPHLKTMLSHVAAANATDPSAAEGALSSLEQQVADTPRLRSHLEDMAAQIELSLSGGSGRKKSDLWSIVALAETETVTNRVVCADDWGGGGASSITDSSFDRSAMSMLRPGAPGRGVVPLKFPVAALAVC